MSAHILTAGDRRMEGKRIKGDASPAIYLCMEGKLRHVTSMTIYDNLFGANAHFDIYPQGLVDNFPKGRPLDQITALVQGFGAEIYLIDQGKKRWIHDMTTFKTYFDKGKTTNIGSVVSLLPDGPVIKM